MDTGRNDLLGELAADAALERSDFIVQSHGTAPPLPRRHKRPHRGARRADPHRRRARLPVDRARPVVPQPQPLPRRAHRRVGQRDRGHRVAPPSWSSSTTRPTSTPRSPRPPARPPGWRPSRPPPRTCSRSPGIAADETVGAGRGPVRRAPPTRGPPARTGDRGRRRRDEAARRLYDLALEFQERSQRSEARLLERVRGRGGRRWPQSRRPGHRRRRRRAARR